MYRGHAGLSLFLFCPFMFLFRIIGADMNSVLVTCFLMVALSFIPDLDILMKRIQWKTRHRGITHTLLFGVVVGVLFSCILGYCYGSLGWSMGFVAGFGGTASHLLGDALAYGSFKPLYPFSSKELVCGFFEVSNRTANNAVLLLGIVTFLISYVCTA